MSASCGKEWTRRFLLESFSKTFLQKEWKKSREKIAFDRETAQLPATQVILEERKEREKISQELRVVLQQLDQLKKKYKDPYLTERTTNVPADFAALRDHRDVLRQILKHGIEPRIRPFVRACPAEECRGFLSDDWVCGMCHEKTCNKCHAMMPNDQAHTCNPDEVATANLLSKDTKPCPTCHTGIFKIDGCDQMWCTGCHTAFSWRTGQIETKIHNPHYYEWQRNMNGGVAPRVQGDNPNPNPCQGGIPLDNFSVWRIHQLLKSMNSNIASVTYRTVVTIVENIIRDTLHLREVEFPTFLPNRRNEELAQNIRIRYLEKQIDKDGFLRLVLKESKRKEMALEVSQILDMFIKVVSDIMDRVAIYLYKLKKFRENQNMHDFIDMTRLLKILREVETIREYTNERLRDVYTIFGYKVRQINYMNDDKRHMLMYPAHKVFGTENRLDL